MKTFNLICIALIGMFTTFTASAQNNVGIGTITPNANAVLDVVSTTQGLLPPRMTKAERDLIVAVAPATTIAEGLVIYCTDCGDGELQVYNGSAWKSLNETGCGLSIGDTYAGGIIFYLDASGCHGLISAASDQSIGITWWNGSYTNTTAFASCVGCGDGNTSMVVNNQGSGSYAAKLCYDLTLGGQSDWYLPSKYELNLMYENIGQGNALGLGNVGGFAGFNYWSSTEFDYFYAWRQYFSNGNQYYSSKDNTYYVRAVRAF